MKGRGDPGFLPLLRSFDPAALDEHASTIYGCWPDLTLAYVNPAWDRFAADNGGQPAIRDRWDLGCRLLDATAPELHSFYTRFLQGCLQRGRPRIRPEGLHYECSSAHTFRRFRMGVHPLEGRGILIVNHLVVELPPAGRVDHAPRRARYLDPGGVIRQCAHCRCTRRADGSAWDWVAAWIDRSAPETSHTLCPTCRDYFYPPEEEDEG